MSKIIRLPAVIEYTGLSRSSIYLQMKKGSFPKNISLGERATGWLECEIFAWIDCKVINARPVDER